MNMQHLHYIKQLLVDQATYQLVDEHGTAVVLAVDYTNNTFELRSEVGDYTADFSSEVERFANGLLARKHGVNLADGKQYL